MRKTLQRWTLPILGGVFAMALLAGLVGRKSAGVCDYIAQACIAFLVFLYPLIVEKDCPFLRRAKPVFLFTFIWGIWRFVYFDSATKNDIPGLGYLIAPFMTTFYSSIVFIIRRIISSIYSLITGKTKTPATPEVTERRPDDLPS